MTLNDYEFPVKKNQDNQLDLFTSPKDELVPKNLTKLPKNLVEGKNLMISIK